MDEQKLNKRVEEYTDTEGISTKSLNKGLWLVSNRKNFRKIFIIFLSLISFVTWSCFFYTFGYYIVKGMKEDEIMLYELVKTETIGHEYIESISAQDLIYSTTKFIKTSQNNYDLATKIQNPNSKYWGEIEYCFTYNGENLVCSENFILPGETKYLLDLALELQSGISNVKLDINKVSWQRINLHKYPDWEEFKNEHLDISTENIDFETSTVSGLSNKLALNSLTFNLRNNTVYDYWDVGLNIFLYSGNNLVGVSRYGVNNLTSLENRLIEMSLVGNYGKISSIEIIPELNITRDNIYMR